MGSLARLPLLLLCGCPLAVLSATGRVDRAGRGAFLAAEPACTSPPNATTQCGSSFGAVTGHRPCPSADQPLCVGFVQGKAWGQCCGISCNTTAWDEICPPNPSDWRTCFNCCQAHKALMFNMSCIGPDSHWNYTWQDHCEGKPPPPWHGPPPAPPAPAPPPPGPIVLDMSKLGRAFDGLGAISGGGATSRLLVDYPATQQEQILDYLFKPYFGASLQILKVEIGSDTLTTDGSESCHMRDNSTTNFDRGYEWWLMKEAKKRNPEIRLYGLPWNFAGWVQNDPATGAHNNTAGPFQYPEQTARYVTEWVKGAKSEHGLQIDYVGIWNESPCDGTYVKQLRQSLDGAGFHQTKIVAQDGGLQICLSMKADPALAKVVDIIGLHYPSDFGDLGECDALGKPIWASEESSSYDDLNGAACWARVVQSHYVMSGITASIMWNLVGAYYPGTSWFASSMLTSVQPWSGHYSHMAPVWATAHVTQFAAIGWHYLKVGSGSGLLRQGGYFTTMVDPNTTAFSLHVVKNSFDHAACTRPHLPTSLKGVAAETITFKISDPAMLVDGSKPVIKLACWRSNFELETPILFEQQQDVLVTAAGTLTLNVSVGDYFTVSTVRTAVHGAFTDDPVPASEPHFPLPYHNDFEDDVLSQQPRLFSQMVGAFEVAVDSRNASNKVVVQGAPQQPTTKQGTWVAGVYKPGNGFNWVPQSLIGMKEWADISISARFRLPDRTAGACLATRTGWVFNNGVVLCIEGSGHWNLTDGLSATIEAGNPLASGTLRSPPTVGEWHTFSLTTLGAAASADCDGEQLFLNLTSIPPFDSGFAALGTTGYTLTEFDDVEVTAVGPDWTLPPPPASCAASIGHRLRARRCQWNGLIAPDQEWSLVPQSWQLQHKSSSLCATATSSEAGAAVELRPCNFTDPLQAFKNDYSNIQHGQEPLIVEAANLTLTSTAAGDVSLQPQGWAGGTTKWRAMYSTGQLRSWAAGGMAAQEEERVSIGSEATAPLCISLC